LASFPRQKVVNANPQEGAKIIIEGLLNLLEQSHNHGVKKFVYISSSMVYGSFTDDVREDYTCNPEGQYAIMKYAGELLVKDYACRKKLKYTILRPSAVYGELDVADRVISKFMSAAIRNDTLNIYGPQEVLDFTHVSDAAEGIVGATLSENTENKTYNITRSQGCDLRSAATLITKIAGSGNIKCFDRDLSFPSRGTLNINAAKQDFGFNPKISIEQGFSRYYDWYSKNSN
jgi:nucleoside-diphosphate-sugar epimerase